MNWRSELRAMLGLAAPLVLSELGWMAMGIEDTMFVGRVSAEAIGAVSLGGVLFYTIGVFASGLLLGRDTLVNGVWLALVLIPVVMGMVWALAPALAMFGINQNVLRDTTPYLRALNWSAPPLLLFFCFRRYLQSIGVVRPILITLIAANLVNLAGNWIFVFGNLGAPRLGAEGSAWSTCISRACMMAALGGVIWRRDRGVTAVSWRPDLQRVRRLLRLGLPAAGQIGLEMAVFATVTVLVGKLSAEVLAAHQVTMTTVTTTFMLPLGISSAAAVRVGHAIGRRDPTGAAQSGWTALGMGATVMAASALALLIFPKEIARLFTPDLAIIAAAIPLLRVAAFFQLFDGLQVTATGALRGAGDTHTPMLCHFAGYWVIGLPLGVWLGFGESLGATGLWMGLSAGLIAIGIVLLGFWRRTALPFLRIMS